MERVNGNSDNRNEIMLEHCCIWLRKDSVLVVSLEKGADIGFDDARKIMDTITVLSHFGTHPIVFDIRPAQLDMAARILITGERFAAIKKSVALIVPSFFSKFLSNFSFFIERPSFPIRAFVSEREALRWSQSLAA